MPPKRKQIKNPFYYFMVDFKEKSEKSGKSFPGGMKEVAELAGPKWNSMNSEEKEHYNKMAAKIKKKDNEDLTKKFTSLGVSYADLDAEEKEQEEAYQTMVDTVRNTVRSLSRETSLQTEIFYVCHVNYYYKTERGLYCPAEVAIAEFNLERGLIDTLHSYIDGKLELGFRYEATDWSLKTHNLPVDDPTWNQGEKDYFKLYNRVISFLRRHTGNSRVIPPIFTMPDSLNNNTSISAVKSLFSKLAETADQESTIFRIYPLPFLFFELRNHCVDDVEGSLSSEYKYLPTVALAENEMEKDVFTYAKNLGCQFHEEKDLATFCSLSIVTRWVFTICDHCCNQLGIKLVLGCHCPKDADVNRAAVCSRGEGARGNPGCSSSWKQVSSATQNGQQRDSRSVNKDHSFMPTIIDHGKLREEQMAQGGCPQRTNAFTLPEDVRLPKKAMYSTAMKQNMGGEPAPRLTSRDFPEMGGAVGGSPNPSRQDSRGPRPGGVGRGRGFFLGGGEANEAFGQQRPSWPISGRGAPRQF